MKKFFQLWCIPWTARQYFTDAAQFQRHLACCRRVAQATRTLCLLLAAVLLLGGYFLNRRPLMVLTVVPLLLILGLTAAMEQIEAAMDGQDNEQSNG